MPTLNMSSVSSGHYSDMGTSIASVPTNKVLLDNLSNFYNYNDIIQFPMSFLRKYENIIKANLVDYKIEKSRYYRPEYISWDLYGTTDLWYLILFVNDLKNPMELNYDDIKVPNSMYIMEIMNKLKNIDKIKFTHKNPNYIYQSLLKDINLPSEKILQNNNEFISDPTIIYEDKLDEFENTFFSIESNCITRDKYMEHEFNPTSVIKESESTVNFGFIPNTNFYKSLSCEIGEDENNIEIEKKLKSNTKYYILKRYAGKMNLTIKSKDENFKYNYNKKIFNDEKMELTPTILTYDLREGTLAPEFLLENLIVNYNNKIYDPEIITNKNGEECYGVIIGKNKYEIFFDGTAYYIVLSEDLKKNEKTILLLENKDYDNKGKKLNTYHSMNEWIFNNPNEPLLKIDEEDGDLYFNESYYNTYGDYVYSLNINKNNLNSLNNMKYRIDINRDLKTNNNNLEKYQFLGFEFECNLSYNGNIDDINDILDFSPLKISIVTNELDSDGNNIIYNFSYPHGYIPKNLFNNYNLSNNINYNNIYMDNKLFKYKRIIPIINNLEEKKLLDIKEILVSPYLDILNKNKEIDFDGNIIISCGKLKIFGLKYEDMVYEYKTPITNSDIANYNLSYNYSIKDTKYDSINESAYFEPYIFEEFTDILSKLSDDNNLDYSIKNNLCLNKYLTNKDKLINVYKTIDNNFINKKYYNSNFFIFGDPNDNTNLDNRTNDMKQLINKSDFLKYKLLKYNEENNSFDYFKLSDNYILDMELTMSLGDINELYIKDNKKFLNGYNKNNTINELILNLDNKIFHNNCQLHFDMIGNNSYCINFGEIKYLSNGNSNKKETKEHPYENKNLFLKNFNSYPFTIDTDINGDSNKIYYEKFRSIEFDKNNNFKRSIINLKIDNTSYSMPGGIYKTIFGEGCNYYQPYKYIDYFKFRNYPIMQTKIFSNNYIKYIQNDLNIKNNIDNYIEVDPYTIYLRIKKINNSYFIFYKFNRDDKYSQLYKFNDHYKSLNNGTIGFSFINNIPYKSVKFTNYQIGKKCRK